MLRPIPRHAAEPGAAGNGAPTLTGADADVINALTALGYSLAEARGALSAIPDDVAELDGRILAALRALGSS